MIIRNRTIFFRLKLVVFHDVLMNLKKHSKIVGAMLILQITIFALAGCNSLNEKVCWKDDFEKSLDQWSVSPKNAVQQVSTKSTNGKKSILLTNSCALKSDYIKLSSDTRYIFSMDTFSEKSGLIRITITEYDKTGKAINHPHSNTTHESMWEAGRKKRNFWFPISIPFDTSSGCDHITITIKKWSNKKVWLDNLEIKELSTRTFIKAKTDNIEKYDSLALMLPGPDGFQYPNWTQAGLHTELPLNRTVFKVDTYGAVSNDNTDDTQAIETAIDKAENNGGGIVEFGPGTYRLTRKLMITSDNIVLRGSGKDKTRLEFGLPDNNVIMVPVGNINIHKNTKFEVFFRKQNAEKVTLYYKDKSLGKFDKTKFISLPDARDFNKVMFKGAIVIDAAGEGTHLIKAVVSYANGVNKASSCKVIRNKQIQYCGLYSHSVITFVGRRNLQNYKITSELHRGDRVITLEDASAFKPGNYISINAPQTERWNKLAHNICTSWGTFRQFVTIVKKVKGRRITLAQPLRLDYPLVDGPVAKKFLPISNCAISDMTISQMGEIQKELKMGTIFFMAAANCLAENLIIDCPGTQAVFASSTKFCEVRNCVFRNPWRTKSGGLAYTGWERSWDCLIDNVETFRMRHSPLLNWSSSGNVVRNLISHECDAQWHSGWCRENLYEQCTIESTTTKYNGYGYAFYSTPTADSGHGPNGPRNVVYNCKALSLRDGFHLGGMNQQWMLMYNTLTVDKGCGIFSRFGCIDNIIHGNVFVLKDPGYPMIYYEFIDNIGDHVTDNTIYGGNGKLFGGPGKPSKYKDNRFLPLSMKPTPAKAPVPSIYLWQKKKYSAGKK